MDKSTLEYFVGTVMYGDNIQDLQEIYKVNPDKESYPLVFLKIGKKENIGTEEELIKHLNEIGWKKNESTGEWIMVN